MRTGAYVGSMDEYSELRLAIARISFLKTEEKVLLSELLDSPERLAAMSVSDLESIVERRIHTRQFRPEALLEAVRADRIALTRRRIAYTFYQDTDYPPQLREIFDPPFVLYYRGALPDYERPLVCVVGTRNPTGKARKAAYRLGFELGREGLNVVSGLALGIDGMAHEGNLAAEGRTVAVLGCGIDSVYPGSHRELAARVISGGGVILSEYPPGTPALQYHFPARNRILSGLSRAVVVVEAPERSGALITADYALDQGRDLYVHADGVAPGSGEGTRRLASDGAPVIRGAAGILADWGIPPRGESVCEVRTETARELSELLEQELAGRVVRHLGNYFRRE